MTDKPVERKDVERLMELAEKSTPALTPPIHEVPECDVLFHNGAREMIPILAREWLSMDERIGQAEAERDAAKEEAAESIANDTRYEALVRLKLEKERRGQVAQAKAKGRREMREAAAKYLEESAEISSNYQEQILIRLKAQAIRALPIDPKP